MDLETSRNVFFVFEHVCLRYQNAEEKEHSLLGYLMGEASDIFFDKSEEDFSLSDKRKGLGIG